MNFLHCAPQPNNMAAWTRLCCVFLSRCGSRTGGWRIKGNAWPCLGLIQQIPAFTPTWWRTLQLQEVCLTLSTRTCRCTTTHMSASRQQPRPLPPPEPPRRLSPPPSARSIPSVRSHTHTHGRSSCAASDTRDCTSQRRDWTAPQRLRRRPWRPRPRRRWALRRPAGPAPASAATAARRPARWAPGAPVLTSPAPRRARGLRVDFCPILQLFSARPRSPHRTSGRKPPWPDNPASPGLTASCSLLFWSYCKGQADPEITPGLLAPFLRLHCTHARKRRHTHAEKKCLK